MVMRTGRGDFWENRTADQSMWEKRRSWERRARLLQMRRERIRRRVWLAVAAAIGILVGATIARANGPRRATVVVPASSYRAVVVQPGDTVWALARRHGDPAEELPARVAMMRDINGGSLSRLVPGQVVRVPR